MKTSRPSILNRKIENELLRRISTIEQQVSDLTEACRLGGISIHKCEFCGTVIQTNGISCPGNPLLGVNCIGIPGIFIKGNGGRFYFCADHLTEVNDFTLDWNDLEEYQRAEYTVALWLLRHSCKSTPRQVTSLKDEFYIKEKMLHLVAGA